VPSRPVELRKKLLHVIDRNLLRARAAAPHSAVPRPFLRWVGSKRSIVGRVVEHLPDGYNRYFEPFLGAGALFFLLRPSEAYIGDKCQPLIETYSGVRDSLESVIRYLRPLVPHEKIFYSIRSSSTRSISRRSAHFIYLNKTCWNGLYRVNSKGEFNVPYGRPKSGTICDFTNLRKCAEVLRQPRIRLTAGDFGARLAEAERGDVVYLDPPYVSGHSNNGFRDYNEILFRWEDQQRLAEIAHELRRRGVSVVISNAYHDSILRLYRGFKWSKLERKSTLASDVSKRGVAQEVIFY